MSQNFMAKPSRIFSQCKWGILYHCTYVADTLNRNRCALENSPPSPKSAATPLLSPPFKLGSAGTGPNRASKLRTLPKTTVYTIDSFNFHQVVFFNFCSKNSFRILFIFLKKFLLLWPALGHLFSFNLFFKSLCLKNSFRKFFIYFYFLNIFPAVLAGFGWLQAV